MKSLIHLLIFLLSTSFAFAAPPSEAKKESPKAKASESEAEKAALPLVEQGAVYEITIDAPITPATDDFLRTSIEKAEKASARLFVLRLDTPGGLLTSMQKMVESLLEAPMPTAVYVSPGGAGAISAGVFVTMAGHFAVMAPGTTIGAAHPVTGGGGDVEGDMGTKVENFAVSLVKAIAEQRGRNTEWAEEAVRESVAITNKEAVEKKVVDFTAENLEVLLEKLEDKRVEVKGKEYVLKGISKARRIEGEMSFKQEVVAFLADPNIAILLGLLAFAGIGIELYHPGAIFPGLIGGISLIFSLIASQAVPIRTGGVLLLLLGAALFTVELFLPSFGIWGGAGIVCLVLGAIYFVDTDVVWSGPEFAVNTLGVGITAAVLGLFLLAVCYAAIRAMARKEMSGAEALLDEEARAIQDFVPSVDGGSIVGRVSLRGEIWQAEYLGSQEGSAEDSPKAGDKLKVKDRDGLLLKVVKLD